MNSAGLCLGVVHGIHLLGLQIYAGSFETAQWLSFLKADTYRDCIQLGEV
jgi:hypothetical protein